MRKNIILMVCFCCMSLSSSLVVAGLDKKDLPWHLKINNVSNCWDKGWRGQSVIVEVWDSKVYFNSPLLKDKLYDKGSYESYLGSGCNETQHDTKAMLHGTAMASLILCTRQNSPLLN